MNEGIIITFVGLFCTVAGTLFGFAIYRRNIKNDGHQNGIILSDIGYIKSGIDDLKLKQEQQELRYIDILTRLSTVETKLERIGS